MFPPALLIAFVVAQSVLIAAAPDLAPVGGTQQSVAGNVQPQNRSNTLYTITSASIVQYPGPEQSAGTKFKARQALDTGAQPMGDANNPASGMTVPASNRTTGNSSVPHPAMPSEQSYVPPPAMPSEQPYVPPPPTMENFNLTVVQGASSANTPSVLCNLTWDAGEANSGTRDHIANKNFTCTGGQAHVRMERRNVTPLVGFYIFVQIG